MRCIGENNFRDSLTDDDLNQGIRMPLGAVRDEIEEQLLDRLIGEELLRGVRLGRVLAARVRVLRDTKESARRSGEGDSDRADWQDRSPHGLYPA